MSDAALDFQTPPAVRDPLPLDDCEAPTSVPAGDRDNEQLSVCAAFWAY